MANIKPKMTLALRQNNNMEMKGYGKYFPVLAHRINISQAGLSKHIAEHGLGVQPSIINAVVTQFSKCLVEMLQQGIGVQVDNLGILYPTVLNNHGGLPNVAKISEGQDPVKGIRMRFQASSTEDCNLTGKGFKERVSLECPYVEEWVGYYDEHGKHRAKRNLESIGLYPKAEPEP